MMYLLLFILSFGNLTPIQNQNFIGKWEVIEFREIDDETDVEKAEDLVMNIYSNGKLEVIEEGDVEEREWKVIDGVFYLIDEGEKESVKMVVNGDDMTWEYDDEIIVFKRIK